MKAVLPENARKHYQSTSASSSTSTSTSSGEVPPLHSMDVDTKCTEHSRKRKALKMQHTRLKSTLKGYKFNSRK